MSNFIMFVSTVFGGAWELFQIKVKYTVSSTPAPELPSMFDWLLDSVNAFLNFEIAPNFTLNKLFFIVLVIGVLLWFIALLT